MPLEQLSLAHTHMLEELSAKELMEALKEYCPRRRVLAKVMLMRSHWKGAVTHTRLSLSPQLPEGHTYTHWRLPDCTPK
jgi:hypothetical protein